MKAFFKSAFIKKQDKELIYALILIAAFCAALATGTNP